MDYNKNNYSIENRCKLIMINQMNQVFHSSIKWVTLFATNIPMIALENRFISNTYRHLSTMDATINQTFIGFYNCLQSIKMQKKIIPLLPFLLLLFSCTTILANDRQQYRQKIQNYYAYRSNPVNLSIQSSSSLYRHLTSPTTQYQNHGKSRIKFVNHKHYHHHNNNNHQVSSLQLHRQTQLGRNTLKRVNGPKKTFKLSGSTGKATTYIQVNVCW